MSNSQSGESASSGQPGSRGRSPASSADSDESASGSTRAAESPPIATLEAMCYDGEHVLDTVRVGDAALAVTTHRLLTLAAPDADSVADDSARFRAVHLPNVRGVDVGATGTTAHAYRAARYGVYALVLLVASTIVNLEGAIQPVDAPSGTGLGGIVGFASLASRALGALDDVLLVLGLLALLVALAFGAYYARGRQRFLEVDVAGADSVRLATDGVGDVPRRCSRVEGALARAREKHDTSLK